MKYTIDVDEELNKILESIADKNKLTPTVYAQNIVNGWLENQYRGQLTEKIKIKTINQLKNLNI